MVNLIFSFEEERYLLNQVTLGSDRIATKALQWTCGQLRKGYNFVEASKFRAAARSALARESQGAKRWAINALAEVGTRDDLTPVAEALSSFADDPDLMVAAIAAVFSIADNSLAVATIKTAGIPIEGLALIAAAQHSRVQRQRLAETLIPLETQNCAELRAAIILAGTNKAPENLFHRTVNNIDSLSELNLHHDPATKKYSVWGLCELKAGFSKLRLRDQDIESCPDEVRKWIFRLLLGDSIALSSRIDMIDTVRRDPSQVVREEAAYELRDTFTQGMQKSVKKWLLSELHDETRLAILDHMACQSEKSEDYSSLVLHHYQKSPHLSDARNRIEAAARKTSLYKQLRRIALIEESGSLFANDNIFIGGPTVNFTQNIVGSQIGSVTGTGNISAGIITAVQSVQSQEAKAFLAAALDVTAKLPSDSCAEGQALILEATATPNVSTFGKVQGWLKGIKDTVVGGGEFAESIGKIIDQGSQLL